MRLTKSLKDAIVEYDGFTHRARSYEGKTETICGLVAKGISKDSVTFKTVEVSSGIITCPRCINQMQVAKDVIP